MTGGGGAAGGHPLLDDGFLRRLERLTLRTRRSGRAIGGRPSPHRTPAADFIDHRPYSPGDDRRHIDWHAVARHDEVFVKIGQTTHAADVYVVLDNSASMGEPGDKRRLSLELAAALGWMSLASGDRLAVTAFPGPPARSTWGPASGGSRGADLLSHLSRLAVSSSPTSVLQPTVGHVVDRAAAGGLLVVISDLWVVDDLESALAQAPPPRWDVLVLHVLARSEIEPTLSGPIMLADSESAERVELTVDAGVRAEYRAALNARLDRLRHLSVGRGASYALVPADWPLERAVIPYLQRKAAITS